MEFLKDNGISFEPHETRFNGSLFKRSAYSGPSDTLKHKNLEMVSGNKDSHLRNGSCVITS